MSSSFEQVFLAIAVKNHLMTREAAAQCLQLGQGGARRIQDVVREKGLLKDDQIAMLEAAAQRVQQGQTGTIRVVSAPAPPPSAPINPNEPVPGYAICGKLGVGGTATVFLADDRKNGNRKVALKILKPALAREEKSLKRFLREADLLTKFAHPNLVRGYDYGAAGPLTYLAMEFLEGESVFDVIQREKTLSEARALEILLEAAKALSYIQGQGIIHRDIKPDNLMITKDKRIVLCDLGFAIPITPVPGEEQPTEETTSDTVQYMSPEQARGLRDLDVRTDIYALGATLYHMVMGDVPFKGDDSLEVMAKQVMEALNSSELKNRRISKHMHYFIERMMSKEKDLRYASPAELVEDINAQIDGFRSLEFRPEEVKDHDSVVLSGLKGDPSQKTTRRVPTSKRFDKSKLSEITRRFKKR